MSVSDHYNHVAMNGCKSAYCNEQRRAHNLVKHELLCDVRRLLCAPLCDCVVVDYACGRGGDVNKLKDCKGYYGADIAAHALAELTRRANQTGLKLYDLVCCDAADVPWKDLQADISILNFALHYFTDSEEHCRRLIERIARNTRHGGVWCGTAAFSQKLNGDDRVTGTVPSEHELDVQPWGHEYLYTYGELVNASEFVINFDKVVELAFKCGFYLILKRSFVSYAVSKSLVNAELNDSLHFVFIFRRCCT